MALITIAEAQQEIPELAGTLAAGDTAYLTALIAAVGARMAAWCGYPRVSVATAPTMESATYTRYLTGLGGRDLVFPIWPLTSITSIYDDPGRSWEAASLVASGDYAILDAAKGHILLTATATHGSWSTTEGAIKVTAVAGLSTVDETVKHAARTYVRLALERRRNAGKLSESVQGASASFPELTGPIPAPVRELLVQYRLPSALL